MAQYVKNQATGPSAISKQLLIELLFILFTMILSFCAVLVDQNNFGLRIKSALEL